MNLLLPTDETLNRHPKKRLLGAAPAALFIEACSVALLCFLVSRTVSHL